MELGRRFVLIVLASALFLVVSIHTDAHKPITSKYDFNRDVFPLLRDHCGSCHVEGGPAPMSLMTYKNAMPWAEAIRDEITTGRMPPWPVDATSPSVQGGHPITSREINMIVVWASGGTPEGNTEAGPTAVAFNPQWKLGQPDLKIPMEMEHTVAAEKMEEIGEFSLPTNLTESRWVKAADLMPGTASIVRDAIISIENGPVLALWEPGGDTTAAPAGVAFRLAPGSKIHLQVHYKKNFNQEQSAVSDRSTVGLYFTDPPPSGGEVRALTIDPPNNGKLAPAARVVAIRPMLDRPYASLNIEAITPAGMHVPLLALHGPRPQWFRRYWLREPVTLAGGTEIVVNATPLSDNSDEPKVTARFPLQVSLDYIAQ
jgi:hypothetical protein